MGRVSSTPPGGDKPRMKAEGRMRLDRELQKEIRALYGDGGQAARLDALARVYQARDALSRLEVRRTFPDALRAHGRAAVAVCVAATHGPAGNAWTAGGAPGPGSCWTRCHSR